MNEPLYVQELLTAFGVGFGVAAGLVGVAALRRRA